jgi:hypothetical protein
MRTLAGKSATVAEKLETSRVGWGRGDRIRAAPRWHDYGTASVRVEAHRWPLERAAVTCATLAEVAGLRHPGRLRSGASAARRPTTMCVGRILVGSEGASLGDQSAFRMSMPSNPWSPNRSRWVDRVLETSTGAARVETDQGSAVAKMLGNPEGPQALFCDWVGTRAAAWLGLSTFDVGIVDAAESGLITYCTPMSSFPARTCGELPLRQLQPRPVSKSPTMRSSRANARTELRPPAWLAGRWRRVGGLAVNTCCVARSLGLALNPSLRGPPV